MIWVFWLTILAGAILDILFKPVSIAQLPRDVIVLRDLAGPTTITARGVCSGFDGIRMCFQDRKLSKCLHFEWLV